jgi:hypothetical protein
MRDLEDDPGVELKKMSNLGSGANRVKRSTTYHQSTGLPLSSRHEMPGAAAVVTTRSEAKSRAERSPEQ